MKTNDYFNEQLKVQFTMSELMQIASALANVFFNEAESKRDCNANIAWELRKKVCKYIDLYNKIYK